jgi:dipeptidyl aminopeptidase/acylaminoacyl peptidase
MRTFLSLLWLLTMPVMAQSFWVYEQAGNILLKNADGSATPLTAQGQDSQLTLSPDGQMAVFVRTTTQQPIQTGAGEGAFTELWLVNRSTRQITKLVSSKESEKMEETLAGFSRPQFSVDNKQVFFLSEAWVTSSSVQKVQVQTGTVKFVTAGNSLEVIRDGKYKGDLRVNLHRYKPDASGSYDCDYIFTPEGKEINLIKDSCDQ